ncbi:MAG: hypothetical protein MJ116_11175 [Lachnospiraceae bacterium]|nr:hypothetical protein [Lachnospiraceae bacterium]
MSIFFEIADISFELRNAAMEMITPDILPYIRSVPTEGYKVIVCHINFVKDYSPVQGNILLRDPYRIILEDKGIERRIFFLQPFSNIYGAVSEISPEELIIETDQVIIDRRFLELLSFEKHLLRRDAFILHSCYIDYDGAGIAFSAPSGTGKSTQGDLWEKTFQAEVINGDRSIIQFKDGEWLIHGLPFCGSSFINTNRSVPLRTIAVVKRDTCDHVEAFDPEGDFAGLVNEITVNGWDRRSVELTFDLVRRLIRNKKAVNLYCTKYASAARCLKEYLEHV